MKIHASIFNPCKVRAKIIIHAIPEAIPCIRFTHAASSMHAECVGAGQPARGCEAAACGARNAREAMQRAGRDAEGSSSVLRADIARKYEAMQRGHARVCADARA